MAAAIEVLRSTDNAETASIGDLKYQRGELL
jgi:hypothetical protein